MSHESPRERRKFRGVLDEVNDQGLLPEGWNQGKYDVSRPRMLDPRMADPRIADPRIAEGTAEVTEKIRLLDAA